jgi:hypothetical protein
MEIAKESMPEKQIGMALIEPGYWYYKGTEVQKGIKVLPYKETV